MDSFGGEFGRHIVTKLRFDVQPDTKRVILKTLGSTETTVQLTSTEKIDIVIIIIIEHFVG